MKCTIACEHKKCARITWCDLCANVIYEPFPEEKKRALEATGIEYHFGHGGPIGCSLNKFPKDEKGCSDFKCIMKNYGNTKS